MAWTITIDRAYFSSEAPGENETYSTKYLNLKGFKVTSDSNETLQSGAVNAYLYGIQVVSQPYSSSFNQGTNSFSNNLPYHSSDYDADTDYLLLGNHFGNHKPGNSHDYDVGLSAGVKSDLKIDLDPLLTDNHVNSQPSWSGLYRGYPSRPEDGFQCANFTKPGYPDNNVYTLWSASYPNTNMGSSSFDFQMSTAPAFVKARNSWKLARSLRSLTLSVGLPNIPAGLMLGTDPDSYSGAATRDAPDQVIYPYSSGDELVTTSGNGPKMWTNSGAASGDPHITTFGGDRYTL